MPRIARIDIEGYWYHIIARGQRKQPLFFSHNDMKYFLKILNDLLKEYDIKLSGFCIMRNHVHLLLFRGKTPLYRFMHRLNTKYAKYFNEKYERVGHVYQGRYKSFIILDERYLINVLIYIHKNPEKSGIVESFENYEFSSDIIYKGIKAEIQIHKLPVFQGEKGIELYSGLLNNKIEIPVYNNSIGTKKEYSELEKRKTGREKGKFNERRKIKDIEKDSLKFLRSSEFILGDLKSKKRTRVISIQRKKLVVFLYEEGYSVSEIARFIEKNHSRILRIVNEYEKNNE